MLLKKQKTMKIQYIIEFPVIELPKIEFPEIELPEIEFSGIEFSGIGDHISFMSLLMVILTVYLLILYRIPITRLLEGGREGPQRGPREPCMRDRVIRLLVVQYILNLRHMQPTDIYNNNRFARIDCNSPEGIFLARYHDRVPSFSCMGVEYVKEV